MAGTIQRHLLLNCQKKKDLMVRKFYFYVLMNEIKKVCRGLSCFSSSNLCLGLLPFRSNSSAILDELNKGKIIINCEIHNLLPFKGKPAEKCTICFLFYFLYCIDFHIVQFIRM